MSPYDHFIIFCQLFENFVIHISILSDIISSDLAKHGWSSAQLNIIYSSVIPTPTFIIPQCINSAAYIIDRLWIIELETQIFNNFGKTSEKKGYGYSYCKSLFAWPRLAH